MAGYIITLRVHTASDEGMENYVRIALTAPHDTLEVIASSKEGHFEILEGDPVEGAVVMRFPTVEDAREWYFSDQYQEAMKHRWKGAKFMGILMEGPDD